MKKILAFLARKKIIERQIVSKKTAFISVVFIASVVVLGIKLVHPAPLQIFVENENDHCESNATTLYVCRCTRHDCCCNFLNLSGIYLLFFDSAPQATSVGTMVLEERKKHWESIAKTLKDDEQKIYTAIIEEGVIAQSEIVEKTGLPKSNVSRGLYTLESKGFVEKRRRGMGNIVLLK